MASLSDTSVNRSARPKRRWNLRAHVWRIVLILSFLFVSNRVVLSLVGAVNRYLGLIKVIFLVYPGSDEMYRRYSYFGMRDWARWRPTLIGVFDQQGSWGLMFAVAATEKNFEGRDAPRRLQRLYARMESIRKIIGAEEVRFAGVLPGRLSAHGVAVQEAEVDSAMAAMVRGEAMVREQEHMDLETPVIVLDANTFVGQKLLRRLAGRNVYPVDGNRLGAGAVNKEAWPAHLAGKPALLLNVARTRTPAAYLDLLWDSVVILNEAYPQPARPVLEQFAARQCRFYHLAGAAGTAYPDFPWPYTDAVPCCAARINNDTELVVRKLV